MNRLKIILLIISLFVFCFAGFTQIVESWIEKQQAMPYEKLYLHTDREFYFEGDTLWFAAYLVDGQTQKFIPGACNLYVDLINGKGDLVKDELFILQDGTGKGYVAFSDSSMLEGNYLLRAYTDYLKNFSNYAFYTKAIQISSHKNSFELEAEKTSSQNNSEIEQYVSNKISSPKIDVSFFPEGGFLLAKESNCVAFKAIDETGKGVAVSGKLFDEQDNLVLTFKSIYKGAGKFYFYPKTGKKYAAKLDGFATLFQLPEIKETGAKIKLINQEQNKIQLIIQAKNINRNQNFYLVATHRGKEIFQLEIDRKKLNSILKINSTQLGGGINSFVLLDENFKPVSERLVFQEELEINKLNVQVSDESFSTREEVQLNLRSDNNFLNELARVSVSVVDENYVNASGISQNIVSWLLLDSELKGHIESPASYLISEDSIASQTKLDLLMTTNGWSNYIWDSLAYDSLKMAIEPQLGLTFKGHVKRGFGKKALSEGNVSLIIFKSDSTSLFFDEPLDLNGNFEFRNVVFYDSASVFAQARNKKDKNTIQFNMELPKIVPPEINFTNLNQLQNFSEIPFSVYRQRYLNNMRLKEFYPDKNNIILEDIEVRAKQPRPKFKTGLPRKNDGPFKLTWEMTAGRFDIVEYLAYNVPGIFSYRNINNELMIKVQFGRDIGPPAFFIDGYQYFSINEIKAFNVHDFKTIEIITPPMSFIYGARAISGAVILTFNRGDEIDSTRPLFGGIVDRINGFTPLREFYCPKYTPDNRNSEAPDYRSTLYWNPSIILTGENELFFNACDNISRYKVIVEGITESGKICLGEANFEVNKYWESTGKLNTSAELHSAVDSTPLVSGLKSESVNDEKDNNVHRKIEVLPITSRTQSPNKSFIGGMVQNKDGEAIEFATLYNITQKTSCISNVNGEFSLEAEIGDSVKIQHLNYHTIVKVIKKQSDAYYLQQRDFNIDEVVISAQFAFDLFQKSCENTWKSLKDENITRAFCKVVRKNGLQHSQTIDLDLDIVQKKQNSFKKGEKIIPYKIQERVEIDTSTYNKNLYLALNLFYPFIHQIYWVDLPKQFNYYKLEDNNYIKIYLISKQTYGQKCNIEVSIHKADTILHSFAMVKKDLVATKQNFAQTDTFHIQGTNHFIEYNYTNDFGYLSTYYQSMQIQDPEDINNYISISQQLKTTNNGTLKLKKRTNRRRIYNNSFNTTLTTNRYEDEFWKNNAEFDVIPYNFDGLLEIKIDDLN